MLEKKNKKKLRIRSDKELSEQMVGLIHLKKVLEATLDKWFLSGGTLLGASRDGDFIPWDWDVEVTVLTEEAREKEDKLLNNLVNAGFLIASLDSSVENFKIVALGWGTEYEILGRYLRASDDSRVRIMTKVPSQFFKKSEIVTFRGHDFPAPSPVGQFLESLYGNWKRPLKSADKKNYFSKDAYIKRGSWFNTQLIDKIYKLMYPREVQEFPVVKNNDLNVFQSWDKELGWCNQPNSTKIDKSDFSDNSKKKKSTGLVVFNTDTKSSRICSNPSKISDISFYGDGYCMCRDVHDSQTYSWYLGKLRNTRVSNYGVSNYGLDQSLLLLQRNYLKDASNTVVLAHSSSTIANCSSVYGHYLEPKSILAIKPRFKVKKNHNELEYIKYPFSSKQDLLILDRYKFFFRSHDQHFSLWKKNKFKYFINVLPTEIASRLGIKLALKNNTQFQYKLGFWQAEETLFLGLISFFSKLSKQYGFRPVFLLQHSLESLKYLKNKENEQLAWSSAINKAKKNFSKIKFLDEAEIFTNYKYPEELYGESYHSPKANHMIADYLKINL